MMIYFSSAFLVLTALAHANGGTVQFKRGVPSYSPASASQAFASAGSSPSQYTKAFRAAPELKSVPAAPGLQQYVQLQPAAYSGPGAQQYYQQYQQAEPQAVAYQQPAVSKYAGINIGQKYSLAPQPQPQQYSSAADVSSFSYSSPAVSYNNLGFLHQIIGKGSGAQQQPQQQQQITYAAAPSPKLQYSPSPSQYSSAQAQAQAQENYDTGSAYQAIAQRGAAYSEQPQSDYQSQAYAQAVANAKAQALADTKAQTQKHQAQALVFQSTQVGQKPSYASVPSYQGLQKAAPQVTTYVASPQQVAYNTAQANQVTYDTGAQTAPQLFYSQQPAAQPQYYSAPQNVKYARPGNAYAQ